MQSEFAQQLAWGHNRGQADVFSGMRPAGARVGRAQGKSDELHDFVQDITKSRWKVSLSGTSNGSRYVEYFSRYLYI